MLGSTLRAMFGSTGDLSFNLAVHSRLNLNCSAVVNTIYCEFNGLLYECFTISIYLDNNHLAIDCPKTATYTKNYIMILN